MDMKSRIASLAGAIPFSGRLVNGLRGYLAKRNGGYILAYHYISGAKFIEHLYALRPDKPVSLSELVDRNEKGKSTKGLFAITVDDGYDFVVRALSAIAVERQCPITFYLPTEYMNGKPLPHLTWIRLSEVFPYTAVTIDGKSVDLSDKDEREAFFASIEQRMYREPEAAYWPVLQKLRDILVEKGMGHLIEELDRPISWEEVSRLSRNPLVSFESHGVSHQANSSISQQELEKELVESKNQIQECTGREVLHYCYPYGNPQSIGKTAPRLVSKHYRSAVTMTRGRVRGSSPFLLPRIPLYEKDSGILSAIKTLTR